MECRGVLFIPSGPLFQEYLCFGGLSLLSVQVMENSEPEIVAALGYHYEDCPDLETNYSFEFPKNKSKFAVSL